MMPETLNRFIEGCYIKGLGEDWNQILYTIMGNETPKKRISALLSETNTVNEFEAYIVNNFDKKKETFYYKGVEHICNLLAFESSELAIREKEERKNHQDLHMGRIEINYRGEIKPITSRRKGARHFSRNHFGEVINFKED